MSLVDQVPTTRGRLGGFLATAVAVWVAVLWVNERLWTWVFTGLLGMAPDDRLTETLVFLFYNTIKIGPSLVVDEQAGVSGRVPTAAEITQLLSAA
ncbi:MAG: hypothetical protein WCG47_27370 [Dermatophilaceae bacterium]